MDIRNRIRRERLGLSQKRFAELTGVDVSSVRRWENSPTGITPDRYASILDDMIATQEHDAKRTLDAFAETTKPITALIWPNQKEMERQIGHETHRSFEEANADTTYFAQLLEHEGHIIDYKIAPVRGKDGQPNPMYEQDGTTLFVPDGNPGSNESTRRLLTRLLANNGMELQEKVGRIGEHAYSTPGLPMDLDNLVEEWAKNLSPAGGSASPFVMRLLVWSLVAREADLQWRYAIRMCDGYEDAGNVELAAGLDAGQVKRIVDDKTLDGLPTRLFDFDVKEER